MSARDRYLAAFLEAFGGDARSVALASACLAERWAEVTHSVTDLAYSGPWRGGPVLQQARERLWLALRGHPVRGAVDEEALLAAIPHDDDGIGAFWGEVVSGYWSCVVNGLRGAVGLATLSSTEPRAVIDHFYSAIRMVACWKAFGDERDYEDDPETDAAILASNVFAAELTFAAALTDRLRTTGTSANDVARVQMWMSQHRWDRRTFDIADFWSP